jgi:cardiolipin synthase
VTRRDLPNLITGLRILLVVPVVVLLVQGEYLGALIVFALAGASDAVDGYLARKYEWTSSLGGWLDPIADKAMLVSAYVTLSLLGHIPLWLVAAVIARDIVIVTGGLVYYYWVERVDAEPSWISKINTVVQLLLIMAVMFDRGILKLPGQWIDILIYTVATTTLLSGFGYVWTWGTRAVRVKRGEKSV